MVIICNHDSQTFEIPNSKLSLYKIASSFMKIASSLRFSNNQDELLFDYVKARQLLYILASFMAILSWLI
jgi:hypothetical protein